MFGRKPKPYKATAAEALAQTIVDAFENSDIDALDSIVHPGQDEKGKKNSKEYSQLLMESGFKITSWKASPWKQPKWEIFRYMRFHPPPEGMIEMELKDSEGHENQIFIACAPLDERYMQCYYVDK